MNKPLDLSLDSDTFSAFKYDFKSILNRTVRAMQEKEVDDAQIAVKFEINLQRGGNPNLRAPEDALEREMTIPMIKHKITASMRYKSEKSGFVGGPNYELVWSKEAGAFVMVPVKDEQFNMLDDGYGYEDYDEEDS